MNIVITDLPKERKIQSIKAIRGATGMGLKEAKDVADAVVQGHPTPVELFGPSATKELLEAGVLYHRVGSNVSVAELIESLKQLLGVLLAVRDVQAERSAAA